MFAVLAAVVKMMVSAIGVVRADEKKPNGLVCLVKSVDATGNSIVVTTGTKDEKTHMVSTGAKITINGESKRLSDIAAGSKAFLTFTSDKKVDCITIMAKSK
jgi:hypothetical protein